MAYSIYLGRSIQWKNLEQGFQSEGTTSECGLANLLSQSLTLYTEAEKTHWHLRLNQESQPVNSESERSIEIAREVCAISLRLISEISRLQRALYPNVGPECAELLTAVGEKIAENRELASERQSGSPEYISALVSRGPGRVERTFRNTSLSPLNQHGDPLSSLLAPCGNSAALHRQPVISMSK